MSEMDLAFLDSLFHQYSDDDLVNYKRNETAFANEAYVITTKADKRYVVRLLKTQSPESARVEATLQAQLKRAGLGTPQYLRLKNGEVVSNYGGRDFTIAEFMVGGHPKTISPKLVANFGATLARIHTSLHGMMIPTSDLQWLRPEYAQRDFHAYSGSLKARFAALLQKGQELFQSNLPKAVIHGDLIGNNIFAADDTITVVFDFETVDYNYRVLDVARTLLSLQSETPDGLNNTLNALIQGYNAQSSNALTQAETDSLHLAIQFTAAACGLWCATHGAEQSAEKYANLV